MRNGQTVEKVRKAIGWKVAFFYLVILVPSVALSAVLGIFILGFWVTSVLQSPTTFEQAPAVIQMLTRSVYRWHARVMWQQQADCVEFDAETLYRPRPGRCRFNNVEFSTILSFDQNGVRVSDEPIGKTESDNSARRVVVVGDSFAMGWGVQDSETFASVLAREYGFHTLNFGVSSYGTVRELRRLKRLGDVTSRDILIIQYCDNDFRENEHFLKGLGVGPYRPEDLNQILTYGTMPVEVGPVTAAVFGNLMQAAGERVGRIVGRDERTPPAGATSADPAGVLLGVIKAFPFLSDSQIVVVPINDAGQSSHLSPGRQVLEAAGIRLVEPTLGSGDFYNIDGHLTKQGHRAVAAAIADVVLNQIRGADVGVERTSKSASPTSSGRLEVLDAARTLTNDH
jgi:lysophospholipase L1-like esterase